MEKALPAAVPGTELLTILALLALQAGITESDRDVSAPKKNVCVLFLLDSMLHWRFQGSDDREKNGHRMGFTRMLNQRQGLLQMGAN